MSDLTTAEHLSHVSRESILKALDRDRAYLVVHPRNRNRRALLSIALQETDRQIYYYSLRDGDHHLFSMLENLVNDFQFPEDFGNHSRQAIVEKGATAEDLAHAFAADLAELRSDRYALVLDELDRLLDDEDNARRFFTELATKMPEQAQIVVDGRQLRRQPWHDLILHEYADSIGDETTLNGGMYDREVAQIGQVEFYALSGHSRIVSDGRSIRSWDGSLPRNLCYYFIERQMVTRQDIFDTFWPHLGVKEATNVFHVTKRKISEKVGYDITSYSNGFYVPSNSVKIMYDARIFEELVNRAVADPDNMNPATWYRAVQLYRHPYLNGLDMPWIAEKRARLKEGYVEALIGLGRFHNSLQEPERALGYFLRAVAEKPNREDVHRNIMEIYFGAGQKDEVVSQYKLLESILKREYSLKPSKETTALYKSLINS